MHKNLFIHIRQDFSVKACLHNFDSPGRTTAYQARFTDNEMDAWMGKNTRIWNSLDDFLSFLKETKDDGTLDIFHGEAQGERWSQYVFDFRETE